MEDGIFRCSKMSSCRLRSIQKHEIVTDEKNTLRNQWYRDCGATLANGLSARYKKFGARLGNFSSYQIGNFVSGSKIIYTVSAQFFQRGERDAK